MADLTTSLKDANNQAAVDTEDRNVVKESQIRKMTRLAIEYNAVNLSQGV